jgi:Flp pilus assembly protein TadD
LINEGTGSATDLFVVQFRYGAPVVTVGSATHGNLSGTAQFVVLPCGLAVRVSNAYISDPLDKSIEVNGNPPDIPVQPTIGDFLEKRDPVLERAIEVVLKDKARFDRVREALLSRIAAAKSSPDGFFQSGSAALSGMRYDEAERAFRKGIELWPGDRQNLQGLVEVYMQQTRTSEAFQVLREALAKDPGRTELWEALGDASVRAGQYEAAKEHYTKALDGTERQPNTAANLHLRIGDIYRRNGDLKQARAELQKAAELVPEDKTIASTLALVSNVMRRTSEAETAYEGNNLFRSMHLHNEAYRMATRGIDLDTALAYALNARQLLPESGEVADTLAFVYLRKGQPALALPLAQEAVRKSPDSATFQHRLGAALAGTGERPGAVTALEAALRSSPPKEVELQIRKLLAELGK